LHITIILLLAYAKVYIFDEILLKREISGIFEKMSKKIILKINNINYILNNVLIIKA